MSCFDNTTLDDMMKKEKLQSLKIISSNITNDAFTDENFEQHKQSPILKSLTELVVNGLNDDSFRNILKNFKNLKRLAARGSDITNQVFDVLPRNNSIEFLDISSCYKLDDIAFKKALKYFMHLQDLDISGLKITNAIFIEFLSRTFSYEDTEGSKPQLKKLIMKGCNHLTSAIWWDITNVIETLKYVQLSGSMIGLIEDARQKLTEDGWEITQESSYVSSGSPPIFTLTR